MKKNISYACMLIAILMSHNSWAEEKTNPDNDTEVEVRTPKSHRVGSILLFPLRIPMYAIKIATFPIAVGGRAMERYHIAERTIDLLSNEDRTFFVYPIIEVGGGSGLGFGLGIVHSDLFRRGYKLGANFTFYTDKDLRTSGYFGDPEAFAIAGRAVGYRFSAGFTKESDEDFFGIGNNSQQGNLSEFAFNDVHGGIEFDYSFAPYWHLKPKVEFAAAKTKTSGGLAPPSVELSFPPNTLAAFDQWTRHLVFGLSLAHDTREQKGSPEVGGLRKATFYRWQGLGQSGFDFNDFRLEFSQYFRLWAPRHVIVLRTAWRFLQETGSSLIPFYRLAQLDINSPLRGFDRGRFRDSASTVFNVEYRYPVWDLIDGSIFVDTGRVYDDPGDFSFKNFKYSVGGGLRFITKSFFLFRIQAAYGGEGVNIVFKATRAL